MAYHSKAYDASRDWSTEIGPAPSAEGVPSSPSAARRGTVFSPSAPLSDALTPIGDGGSLAGVQAGPGPSAPSANRMGSRRAGESSWPDIENHLSEEVIESPTTMDEVYRGSMKALLARNVGNYVVATFLIGTQTTVSWEGILYDVGNDYMAIYQSGREQYIVSDLYSLKYVEFYDTRRRELCDALLEQRQG